MRGPTLLVAALLLSAPACRWPGRRPPPPPPPEALDVRADRALGVVLDSVRAAALRGAHARADSALEAFRAQYFGTPAAAEALYWRALLRVDPANPRATPRDAAQALDAYAAERDAADRSYDVAVARRLLAQLDSTRAVIAALRSASAQTIPRDSLRGREQALQQEIDRTREELERTRAELARVRRRLAPPREP